jgi:hypothetical protein
MLGSTAGQNAATSVEEDWERALWDTIDLQFNTEIWGIAGCEGFEVLSMLVMKHGYVSSTYYWKSSVDKLISNTLFGGSIEFDTTSCYTVQEHKPPNTW